MGRAVKEISMRLLLLILLLLSGYAEAGRVIDPTEVMPGGESNVAFSEFTLYFELRTGVSVSNVPIQFANLKPGMSGMCISWGSGERKIMVDRFVWTKLFNYEQKMQLIWHELGHCRLGIEHSDKVGADGCPTSLMHSLAISRKCTEKWNKKYYSRFLTGEGE